MNINKNNGNNEWKIKAVNTGEKYVKSEIANKWFWNFIAIIIIGFIIYLSLDLSKDISKFIN